MCSKALDLNIFSNLEHLIRSRRRMWRLPCRCSRPKGRLVCAFHYESFISTSWMTKDPSTSVCSSITPILTYLKSRQMGLQMSAARRRKRGEGLGFHKWNKVERINQQSNLEAKASSLYHILWGKLWDERRLTATLKALVRKNIQAHTAYVCDIPCMCVCVCVCALVCVEVWKHVFHMFSVCLYVYSRWM